ncbi:MAG: hypothetical protein HZY76_00520 [Anaerolineae bacterium]|nr:MAG: hypothetical protein HZY76_00520 [Anaerolineae bacterium]
MTSFDAAMRQPGVVESFVWNDHNNDGLQGAGEEGIANVQVELLDVDNGLAVIATAQTDEQGLVSFSGVATGVELRLRYALCSGCSFARRNQGDDAIDSDAKTNEGATGSTGNFRLSQGSQGYTTMDAGMRLPGRVESFVWVDANLNGLQDDGATGLAGVLVGCWTRTTATRCWPQPPPALTGWPSSPTCPPTSGSSCAPRGRPATPSPCAIRAATTPSTATPGPTKAP